MHGSIQSFIIPKNARRWIAFSISVTSLFACASPDENRLDPAPAGINDNFLSEEMDVHSFYSGDDIKDICRFFKKHDPYKHPIQYVQWKGEFLEDRNMPSYERLLGFDGFDGTGLQMNYDNTSYFSKKWVDASAKAGHKWLVGVIEINPANIGVVTDEEDFWHDNVRHHAIWGNLMAGGSGTLFFSDSAAHTATWIVRIGAPATTCGT